MVTPVALPAKVICIGNATVGGTGKTQVAIWLAKKLIARGVKPVILCKGYGGAFAYPTVVDSSMEAVIVGDEALELCEYATTIIAKKPTDAVPLLGKLLPDVIIVDDGMQNPSFIKDFIIMVVDGKRGFGNRMLFPAGPMRQSVESSLKMADGVVVTHYEGEDSEMITRGAKVYKATISIESLGSPTRQPPQEAESCKYYAFTGIGNPERFFALCESRLGNLVATKAFPDHHKYLEAEIAELIQEASKLDAKLITTRKDYVKLKGRKDIRPLNVTLEIEDGDKLVDSSLLN